MCIMRKLLKTTNTEELRVHTNSESCNIQLGSLNHQFNSKEIIQILLTLVIDYFSTHSQIVVLSYYFVFFMIWELLWKHLFLFRRFLIMQTTFSYFPGMFENPVPAKMILKNKIINIMKYQLFTNASKNNRWLMFVISEWFVYDPSWMLHLSEFVFNYFLLMDATDRSKIKSAIFLSH